MRVRFEPIGEEIDCGLNESVLDAAIRQGYNLAYGCREGQCSACKCFLLEGEVSLKPYSTFALSDTERSGGYALMCRAVPEQDLVVELLHYDPDNYRLAHAIHDGVALVEQLEALTHDITRVVLDAPGFSFTPGQYVDLHVGGARRSFSMANVDPDRIELIVKRYPGGRFSGKLDGQLKPGDRIGFTGPYGSLRIRDGEAPILMIAGGSGIAPILSLLRGLEAADCPRPVRLFFGARTPFCVDELERLTLADLRVTLASGRRLLELVDEQLRAGDLDAPDVYMCGPPPMLEAAEAMLVGRRGVDEQRIFQDRFTVAAEADPGRQSTGPRASPVSLAGDAEAEHGAGEAEAPLPGAGPQSEREFSWFQPLRRRATVYEDVTIDTQPSIHRHLTRGWPVSFEDGRGTWDDGSTALRSSDWYAFRDPAEQWERSFYQLETALEQQIEGAIRSAAQEGLIGDFSGEWVEFLRGFLQVPAFVEHGLWFALATAGRDCLSDSVATCVCLQAAMKQRSAQAIVLYAMDLEAHHGPFPIESAREIFLRGEQWQPVRRFLERLSATRDWGEVVIGTNLCFEPLLGTLLRRELGVRAAGASGDTVTPVLARAAAQEWQWIRTWTAEFVQLLVRDAPFGERNRELIASWVQDWLPLAEQAAAALAPLAPAGVDAQRAVAQARRYAAELLAEAGVSRRQPAAAGSLGGDAAGSLGGAAAGSLGGAAAGSLGGDAAGSLGGDAAGSLGARSPGPRSASAGPARAISQRPDQARAATAPGRRHTAEANSSYDYVGIVMAKSAEGDAVAGLLGRREGVVVREQPAFWEIRARDRLVIPYDEVSADLGYEIDAYSIQHEMSTHYGRMVATDEALMLFSDPTEAMEHLVA
jgi:NAD(P)H-flavin reductase/ferredoxin